MECIRRVAGPTNINTHTGFFRPVKQHVISVAGDRAVKFNDLPLVGGQIGARVD